MQVRMERWAGVSAMALAMGLGLTGCQTVLRHPTLFREPCEEARTERRADVHCVTVFYGTNRLPPPELPADGVLREDDDYQTELGELIYGRADVWLPDRVFGDDDNDPSTPDQEYDRPAGFRPIATDDEIPEDEERYFIFVTRIETAERSDFLEDATAEVEHRGGAAMVFVHGFNVTFDSALLTTAQMNFDLTGDTDFEPGAAFAFIWPSVANVVPGFFVDRPVAERSGAELEQFLTTIICDIRPSRLNVIAHSMGTRVLGSALEGEPGSEGRPPREGLTVRCRDGEAFRLNIVMAAAELDVDTFTDLADDLQRLQRPRLSVYASGRDLPLVASMIYHLDLRTGQVLFAPSVRHLIGRPGFERVEVVDANMVSAVLDVLGHGYFANSGTIIGDMRCFLTPGETHLTPQERGLFAVGNWYKVDLTRATPPPMCDPRELDHRNPRATPSRPLEPLPPSPASRMVAARRCDRRTL